MNFLQNFFLKFLKFKQFFSFLLLFCFFSLFFHVHDLSLNESTDSSDYCLLCERSSIGGALFFEDPVDSPVLIVGGGFFLGFLLANSEKTFPDRCLLNVSSRSPPFYNFFI